MNSTKTSEAASKPRFCPQCGAATSNSQTGAPCPACLMQLGLMSWQDGSFAGQIDSTAFHGSRDELPDFELLREKFPHLEIQKLIGRGGMGTVYCARQTSLDRLVALKIIKPEPNNEKNFADRFEREAKALARLNHPNIVTVHDFGQVDDLYYFVMEYVDGVNLRQMIREERLSPQAALQIVPLVCDALQFAHNHGIVHRDIKPENILLDSDGNVKIADFGLAKMVNQATVSPNLTKTNHVMGTMHYMAPEQFEKPTAVDHRADIYSLGVVFYELLTGELPLGRFAPPSKKVSIDVRLDEIVLQTLEKEPSLRYQQIQDVKSDVQTLNGERESYQAADEKGFHAATAKVTAAVENAVDEICNAFDSKEWNPSSPQPPVKHAAGTTSNLKPLLYVGVFTPGGFWQVLSRSQTYKNMLYLFLSFPLGIIYFVLMITGLATGLGTLIIWIGVPVLLGTLLLAKAFTGIESAMVRKLLSTDIRVHADRRPLPDGVFQKAKHLAFSGRSWLNVLFLIFKLPLGVLSFVSLVTLISVPLAFLASPILIHIPGNSMSIGDWQIDTLSEASGFCLIGFFLMFVSAHVLNGVAYVQAQFSRMMLTRRQSANGPRS